MLRILIATGAAAALTLVPTLGPTSGPTASADSPDRHGGGPGGPCVRVGQACYPTVQAAVDAAGDGDTVHIPPGRFRGGIVVTRSVVLAGAGPRRTTLAGGEHVLTVGTFGATTQPTVRISGLTLRGGHASSSADSVDFTGIEGAVAGGAGLQIVRGDGAQADVTVVDSRIVDNHSAPVASILPTPEQEEFWPHCPDGFCPFAGSFGGGVVSWGALHLVRTTVAGNTSGGPLASDADGAGLFSWGDLTLDHSVVRGNRAVAVAPNGRFAEGGGIMMENQTRLTLRHSRVDGNVAAMSSDFPVTNPDGSTTGMLVNSGGVHVNDDSSVLMVDSHIDRNLARVDNPQGQAGVINVGLQLTLSDLVLRRSSVSGNRAVARVGTTELFGPMGSAFQWCRLGTVQRARVVGNVSRVVSVDGDAGTAGALFAGATLCNGGDPGRSTMTDSVVRRNRAVAIAHAGRADTWGAGMYVGSALDLRRTRVAGNVGVAVGTAGGVSQGAGIWNGMFPYDVFDGLHSDLALDHVRLTGNVLRGGPGVVRRGAGLYTRDPVARRATLIAGNRPDQCFGCGLTPSSLARVRRVPAAPRLQTSPLVERLTASVG